MSTFSSFSKEEDCLKLVQKISKSDKYKFIDKSILKFKEKKLSKEINICFGQNSCSPEKVNEFIDDYLELYKSKLRGHSIFTGLFITSGVGISYLSKELPAFSDQLQVLLFLLYHGFSTALFNKKYAQLAKWGYQIKSGAKEKRPVDPELEEIYNNLRDIYDFTEEESRDSLVRAISSITPTLLELNLAKDPEKIENLERIFALNLVNLRIIHKQIPPDSPSLVKSIRGYLGDKVSDPDFFLRIEKQIVLMDEDYHQNVEYYQKYFDQVGK